MLSSLPCVSCLASTLPYVVELYVCMLEYTLKQNTSYKCAFRHRSRIVLSDMSQSSWRYGRIYKLVGALCLAEESEDGQSRGFPGGSDSKASAYNMEDPSSILGQEDPLEKEIATHSSTLAWKIPWTEESGRLHFMGLQRVGHNWATSLSFFCKISCESFKYLRKFIKSLDYMRGWCQ